MSFILHDGDLPNNFSVSDSIAVDTETMGLNPTRDRLCVIQLSCGDSEAHIVRLDEKTGYKAPNLKSILSDRSILKIFHYARFDLSMINTYLKINCEPIFCTKIASKIARTYTDRHGLKDLCRDIIGIEISKQQQSSDWGKTELSKEQLKYAADDVLYLHKLKDKLEIMLKRENRLKLANKCFEFLPARVELDLKGWSDYDIFSH